jgi:hypothetical protein
MAAEVIARAGHRVVVFERMPSAGRKLLMAGRGGLNLTHSEPLEAFLGRYGETAPALASAVRAFPPAALVDWAEGLGQATFTGSSGRIFPRCFKASPLLRAWLARLAELGVELRTRHRWTGWDGNGALTFADAQGRADGLAPAATLLALGGASWPRLGSDGGWTGILEAAGVDVSPLAPSNSAIKVNWSEAVRGRFAGEPLKRIAVTHGGETLRGEAVITRDGLEGGVIYAFSRVIREALASGAQPVLSIDLRPDLPAPEIARRLAAPRGKASVSNVLRKALALPPAAVALAREQGRGSLPSSPKELAMLIKCVPVPVAGIGGLERAISSAGGIRFDALDGNFMLRARPGVFAAGEMLDWEAPTGGYLLQATFATGVGAAYGLLRWVAHREKAPRGGAVN